MKKIVSMFAIAAVLFSVNANASDLSKDRKKKKAKTEKAVEEKKECSTEKKAGCCAAKKAAEQKA